MNNKELEQIFTEEEKNEIKKGRSGMNKQLDSLFSETVSKMEGLNIKKYAIGLGAVAILAVSSLVPNVSHAGTLGQIIGGVGGGVIGNQIGGGNGKTIATALGAVVGASVGDKVQDNMDNNDYNNNQYPRQSQYDNNQYQRNVQYNQMPQPQRSSWFPTSGSGRTQYTNEIFYRDGNQTFGFNNSPFVQVIERGQRGAYPLSGQAESALSNACNRMHETRALLNNEAVQFLMSVQNGYVPSSLQERSMYTQQLRQQYVNNIEYSQQNYADARGDCASVLNSAIQMNMDLGRFNTRAILEDMKTPENVIRAANVVGMQANNKFPIVNSNMNSNQYDNGYNNNYRFGPKR